MFIQNVVFLQNILNAASHNSNKAQTIYVTFQSANTIEIHIKSSYFYKNLFLWLAALNKMLFF